MNLNDEITELKVRGAEMSEWRQQHVINSQIKERDLTARIASVETAVGSVIVQIGSVKDLLSGQNKVQIGLIVLLAGLVALLSGVPLAFQAFGIDFTSGGKP